jgi:hypothetical protein
VVARSRCRLARQTVGGFARDDTAKVDALAT